MRKMTKVYGSKPRANEALTRHDCRPYRDGRYPFARTAIQLKAMAQLRIDWVTDPMDRDLTRRAFMDTLRMARAKRLR